ncbi:hypothetical protein PVK06_020546 [Gossypium arboreum]|uniref:RNase H type-1 domain-containing protein n=1 Tax=Gossypium arboreum TaxID=29729 RepID=A0ABR0PMV1_GOSAR|nr:hypothetical protein PVK06_020546 [Gossypium arboreum]
MTLKHGVQFASEMGFRYVIAESDSRLVINKIHSKEDNYSETRPLTWDLEASTRNFLECRFQFVTREGNSVSHAMAGDGAFKGSHLYRDWQGSGLLPWDYGHHSRLHLAEQTIS